MKSITFRIDDEDKEILQQIADRYGVSVSWVARKAIKDFTTKENKNGTKNNFFAESDVGPCENGVPASSDTTQS